MQSQSNSVVNTAGQWPMMLTLFDLYRNMCHTMATEIEEARFDHAQGQSNSPNWIVGHLALSMDFGLSLLGETPASVARYMPLYGPGSSGGQLADAAFAKQELLDQLVSGGDQLRNKMDCVDPSVLEKPQGTPFLAAELPTVGALLSHIITTHLAMHTGQLSHWRRAEGMSSVYLFDSPV